MYLKYAVGFLIASLLQAGVIAITEAAGISSLNIDMTLRQLVIHVIAGQVAGYLLLFIMRKIKTVGNANSWTLGITWGIIVWAIIVPIAVMQGKLHAPWEQGAATLLSSIIAFVLYGLITTYTIKRFGIERRVIFRGR